MMSAFFLFVPPSAPTLPPTTMVPSTTPSDECDDDQTSCHSGTGDDYDVTGANIALMRLRPNLPPCSPSLHCGSTRLNTTTLILQPVCRLSCTLTSMHAGAHVCAGFIIALISCTCSSHLPPQSASCLHLWELTGEELLHLHQKMIHTHLLLNLPIASFALSFALLPLFSLPFSPVGLISHQLPKPALHYCLYSPLTSSLK